MKQEPITHNTAFVARRADVLNLTFMLPIGFCTCGNDSPTKPALHKCFSEQPTPKKEKQA